MCNERVGIYVVYVRVLSVLFPRYYYMVRYNGSRLRSGNFIGLAHTVYEEGELTWENMPTCASIVIVVRFGWIGMHACSP